MRIKKKVWPEYFQQIVDGKKTFELRLNDFDISEGDTLVLNEWDPATKDYTGRTLKLMNSQYSFMLQLNLMIKEYINYIQDNSERRWFKTKLYGWGWVPATWQGCAVTLIYLGLISAIVLIREESIPGNPDSGSNFLISGLPIILLTGVFIFICYTKGGKPHWQWGIPKK